MVERWFTGKGPNFASLKLKVAAMCGDLKLLANVMKSYPELKDLNTRDCVFELLEGSKLFGSTKQKFDMALGVDCDLHRPDKVNYSIPCPNTIIREACIENSLLSAEHGVAHTTSMLELIVLLHIGILHDCQPTLPKDVRQCKPIYGLCTMPKSELANMTHQFLRTKDCRRNTIPPTMWSTSCDFTLMTSIDV